MTEMHMQVTLQYTVRTFVKLHENPSDAIERSIPSYLRFNFYPTYVATYMIFTM